MVSHFTFRHWFQAILVCMLALALCGCDDQTKHEVLVDAFFLPDESQATVDASFRLCNTVNHKALWWINEIYAASSSEDVLKTFKRFRDSLNIQQSSPSWEDFETVHYKVIETAAGTTDYEVLKKKSAYLLAGFLHRLYLRNADNLRKPLKNLQPIYQRTANGDIPDCVARGKSTYHPAVSPVPWIGGGILLFLLMLLLWFRVAHSPRPDSPAFAAPRPAPVAPTKANTPATKPPPLQSKKQPAETPKSSIEIPKLTLTPLVETALKDVSPPLPKQQETEKPKESIPEKEAEPPSLVVKPPAARPKPKLLYARLPSGGLFYQFSQTFEPNETFFVLSIFPDDPITAFVSLSNDPETREYLFTRMPYQEACELRGTGMPNLADIREVEPGKARFSKEMWVIQSKIKIDW